MNDENSNEALNLEDIYPFVSFQVGNIQIGFNPLRDSFTNALSGINENTSREITRDPERNIAYIESQRHDNTAVQIPIIAEYFQYHNLIKKWKIFTICSSIIIGSSYILGLCVKRKIDPDVKSYDNDALMMGMIGLWPDCEDNRWQLWRLLTNIFVHANFDHVVGNMLGLVLLSYLLEMYQSAKVITPLFIFAIIQSNLAFYYIQPYTFCIGVSDGVFSILGMNIANMIINFNSIPIIQMSIIIYLCFSCVAMEATSYDEANNIAYISHWTALMSGFFGGLTFLKKYIPTKVTSLMSYSSIQIYVIFSFVLLYHYVYDWPPLQSYSNILEPIDTSNCCYEWFLYKSENSDAKFEDFTCPYTVVYDDGGDGGGFNIPLPPFPDIFWKLSENHIFSFLNLFTRYNMFHL